MNSWGWIFTAIVTVAAYFYLTAHQAIIFGIVGAIAFVVCCILPRFNYFATFLMLLAIGLAAAGLAKSAEKPVNGSWSLYTRTFGGTISVVRNLSKNGCEKAKEISMPKLKPGEVVPPLNHSTIIAAECYQ